MKEAFDENIKGIFIEPGSFEDKGGWKLDTQLIPNIGSPYLLAHGLGVPVADAVTSVAVADEGDYNAWIYTRNWIAPWHRDMAPGIFEVYIDEQCAGTYGGEGEEWHWQQGKAIHLRAGRIFVRLHDKTGFEGRLAGIFLTKDKEMVPPDRKEELACFRRMLCGNDKIICEGSYDFVVAGGGLAGICAAIIAARKGLKTAFVNDRFVVGGNNSSEVTVLPGGECCFEPYPEIGSLVMQFDHERIPGHLDRDLGKVYKDREKLDALYHEENIDVYLGYFLTDVKMEGNCIKSAVMMNVRDGSLHELRAELFADCTGDATLGYAAGADYEMTSNGHMGASNMWYAVDTGEVSEFPSCPWAVDLKDAEFPGRHGRKGKYNAEGLGALSSWFWESGFERDPIVHAEYIRDLNFRAMFGAWDAIKNVDGEYPQHQMKFCCYTNGKRESRRLLGDVILTKSDIQKQVLFEDRCVPVTWDIDVHYPDKQYYGIFEGGDSFISYDYHDKFTAPYFIPYRCLYSRNIDNLFMAGRDISVTHDALGTVRVMRTGGMMGEVVGRAAYLCKKHDAVPRQIYEKYLDEFCEALLQKI